MRVHERGVCVLLLAGLIGPIAFGTWPPSIFFAWLLPAAGLVWARQALARRPATWALVVLAVCVAASFVGIGFTLGSTGVGFRGPGGALEALLLPLILGGVFLPTGVFLSWSGEGAPRALARVGTVMGALALAAWVAVAAWEATSGAFVPLDILVWPFGLGGLLLMAAMVWRIAAPVAWERPVTQ